MPLSGPYAVKLGLVEDSTTKFEGVRDCSYDLQIDAVIVEGRTYRVDTVGAADLEIAPQQTFTIVSREVLNIPEGFVGYAFLKTSIARRGILAINTGIIDSGWHNRLATTAINFSKSRFAIFDQKETAFLRIVFERLARGTNEPTLVMEPYTAARGDAYVKEQVQLSRGFPSSFLDIPGQQEKIITQAKEEITKEGWRRISWVVSVVAVLALLLSAVTPILASLASQYLGVAKPSIEQARIDAKLEEQIRVLESQVGNQHLPSNKPYVSPQH